MSPQLHERIADYLDILEDIQGVKPSIPDQVLNGLTEAFDIRPYQEKALTDFITYFSTERFRQYPSQTLFHMATGSGKTLVMAALILHLYREGYRDFLFFVNSTNVLEKTRSNFLDPSSPKYLFARSLLIDGRSVAIREVNNFQFSDPEAINICFSTIQGLHIDLGTPREERMTIADFEERRVVFISDEAHHINALTRRRGARGSEDTEEERTWEHTVNRVFGMNRENVLLEFTATAELTNEAIAAKYEDKVVADYPLRDFREDGYSKEIRLLQADLEDIDRALQAVVLSQYRLKLFQHHGLAIKPTVLFKSRFIKNSKAFHEEFQAVLGVLDAARLAELRELTTSDTVKGAFAFFEERGIDLDSLAAELREDFGETHCLRIDNQSMDAETQLAVNSLEDPGNPYRLIFAVDMLNEGWDVLNLFDIVRLYNTRDAGGSYTTQEAQLIGRGARYCPFKLEAEQDRYKRKFDEDLDNPLRACEELYYHSQTNSRYIEELRKKLRETGALPDRSVEVDYRLKDGFRGSELYQQGWVFLNARRERSREDITELPEGIRSLAFSHRSASGASLTGNAFGTGDQEVSTKLHHSTRSFADIPPSIAGTALRQDERLRFDRLRRKFPNLTSSRQFITDASYLGNATITVASRNEAPTRAEWLKATAAALVEVAGRLDGIDIEHYGTTDFFARPLREVITDRKCLISNPAGDGPGIAQSVVSEELRLNLSQLDWYGYEENYGTTEEKRFLKFFSTRVDEIAKHFDLFVVLRNEGQFAIYDSDGAPFQPDFLLLLHEAKGDNYLQYQVFIEPKGEHLVKTDRWKEDLLLRLEREAKPVLRFVDDNDYTIWGLPFYTHEPPQALKRFTDEFNRVVLGTPTEAASGTLD